MVARVVDLRKGKPQSSVRPLPFPDASAPKRPTPLRARRRRARFAAALMVFILAAAVVYGVHALSYIGPLSIQGIHVSGVKKIDPTIIETYVDSQLSDGSFHFFSRRNIFLYPKAVLAAGIVESFPRVKSASLSRDGFLSRELSVVVEEREPFALWCQPAVADTLEVSCFAIDESGFVFSEMATSTHGEFETTYIFSGGLEDAPIGQRFLPGQFSSILALLRTLQQETNLIPARVSVLQDQDFNVSFEQGFYIKASFGQEPETLAHNLELVLSSESLKERIAGIEYIDLRFGNRVYYKMKGEEQESM